MKDLNRRNFMKVLGGVVAGVSALSKAEGQQEKKVEITAYGTEPEKKTQLKVEYDLINDLVEEMNQYDKKFPGQNIKYFIHCNCTGLAFLNDTGSLVEDDHYIDYSHKLYLFLIKPDPVVKVRIVPRGNVSVKVMPMGTESDLNLIGRTDCECVYDGDSHSHKYTYHLVTTRCFNVNREEEGGVIAGLPEKGYKYFIGRSKEPIPAGTLVGYDEKRGIPWVEPIKHEDFYKDGRIS